MSTTAQRNGLFERSPRGNRLEDIEEFAHQFDMPRPVHIGDGIYGCSAEITPAIAELILECHHIKNNRGKKSGSINCFSQDMANGRWRLSHQGVAFDENWLLFDGQNRLLSCVRAGVPFRTLVFFNIKDDALANTDTGVVRTAIDAARILGITIDDKTVTTRLMAAARVIAKGPTSQRDSIENQMEILRHLRDPLIYLHTSFPCHITRVTIGPVLGAIGRAYYSVDRQRLSQFCETLRTGFLENQDDDSAAGLLYRFLLTTNSAGLANGCKAYAKTESAIDKFIRRVKITKLYEESAELYELPMFVRAKLKGICK